uniref:Uncharacterized protein n=1 Tax=Rhizophora mucronata TaxID=61149 RepID=A0A2P2PL11_RHIMU
MDKRHNLTIKFKIVIYSFSKLVLSNSIFPCIISSSIAQKSSHFPLSIQNKQQERRLSLIH